MKFIVNFVFAFLATSMLAMCAAAASTIAPQWTVVAQNPNNDPDVQRGINQRNEQQRQMNIQACVARMTANMNPTAAAQDANHVRDICSQQYPYAPPRG